MSKLSPPTKRSSPGGRRTITIKVLFPWLSLAAYLALLFGTLSVAPGLWMRVNTKTGGALSNLLPILGIVGFGFLYGILIKRKGFGARREIALLTLIAVCYGILFGKIAVVPLEQYHLVEYGILSALVYTALRRYGSFRNVVALGLVIVVAVGVADELYQWYLPERFFDMRDIFVNVISGVLAFSLIGLFRVKPVEKTNYSKDKGQETT